MAQKANQTARSLAANSEFIADAGWVRKPAVAKHTQLSVRSIDNLVRRKAIPFAKIGKAIRFRLPDVDRALEKFVRKEVGK